MYRLGIDVGGTNTDAVVMRERQVVGAVKVSTTADVTSGVRQALAKVMECVALPPDQITSVMIGTTHFTNALVERRGLDKVAAIRLGLPATACLPPMVDWPEDLRQATGGLYYMVRGGNEFDGRVISPLDYEELERIAKDIKEKGITAVAISSVFSPISSSMEVDARDFLTKHCPGVRVVLSSDIGRIGLLEREGATIINASLLSLGSRIVEAFAQSIQQERLTCPFFITQNDGTLMAADRVRQFPVFTFASGPTNSMRGAAFLTGVHDGIVVDIGGTTSDVGVIQHGFPRQASSVVEVGGVRTNFRMPDVFSVGLGGGSLVRRDGEGAVQVGPQSVGYRITSEALVYGGSTLTATDIAVACGRADIGTVRTEIDRALVQEANEKILLLVTDAVERSRVSPEPIPVIAVGGGSILLPDQLGELSVLRPHHFAVANAVGAAISQVSGEVDRIYHLDKGLTREECLRQAEEDATKKAITHGARPETIHIVDREDVPLAYLPGNATRVHVKAVGELEGMYAS